MLLFVFIIYIEVFLFVLFYLGRQVGRGLGFGLPKCWRIVTLQGGRIEVESNRPTGLCVRVIWPAAVGGTPGGGGGAALQTGNAAGSGGMTTKIRIGFAGITVVTDHC